VAAGSLLVTEAGGLVGNFTGESEFLHEGECVAGNPRIYGQMVGALGKYSRFAGIAKPKAAKGALAQANAAADRGDGADGKANDQAVVMAAFEKSSTTLTAKGKRIKPAIATKPAEGAPEATL
jgi:myo-inositol-1(or 4)-monophosphatase